MNSSWYTYILYNMVHIYRRLYYQDSFTSEHLSRDNEDEDESDVLIECRNVYKSFGEKHILRGVSFKVIHSSFPFSLLCKFSLLIIYRCNWFLFCYENKELVVFECSMYTSIKACISTFNSSLMLFCWILLVVFELRCYGNENVVLFLPDYQINCCHW